MKNKKSWFHCLGIVFALLSSVCLSACDLFSHTSDENPVKRIEISEGESIEMTLETTLQLHVDLIGVSGTITFESDFPAIAKVDDQGLVTAQRLGTTNITASVNGYSDSIEVRVVQQKTEIQKIELSISSSMLKVNEKTTLSATTIPQKEVTLTYEATKGKEFVSITKNQVTALKAGEVTLVAKYGQIVSNEVQLTIYEFEILMTNTILDVGQEEIVQVLYQDASQATFHVDYSNVISVQRNSSGNIIVKGLSEGMANLYLETKDGMISNTLTITVKANNPYENINREEFYQNYTRASSYLDAMYRSEYNLMSGDIQSQDQEPTISSNQPSSNGMLIHNSYTHFSSDKNTYYVYDAQGELAFEVYRGAAYVTLEEVAAYIYAFGDVPINYCSDRYNYPQPYASPWGEYLRLNNSFFSGDVDKYPYEPKLPRIYGIDGDLKYYEVDIGTTGTDCDPRYPAEVYNDGYQITRGAARIVYSRYYADGTPITNLEDRYVFYTYNHYNDFQEYLNYQGGWGEMFGNITGGGPISDYDPNNPPTDYVPSIRQSLIA